MDTAVASYSSTDSRSGAVSSTRVLSNGTVFLVHERGSRRRIKLEVCQPVTITSKEGLGWTTTFTSYLIQIDTNHYAFSLPYSEVRRRFSEFCWLHSKLAYHNPNKIVPPIPPKTFIYATKFNGNVIEQRCIGLGKFLQRIMRSSVFLSDAALHYFLQTNLSIKEIEEKLEAEIPVRSIPISQLNKPKKRPKSAAPFLAALLKVLLLKDLLAAVMEIVKEKQLHANQILMDLRLKLSRVIVLQDLLKLSVRRRDTDVRRHGWRSWLDHLTNQGRCKKLCMTKCHQIGFVYLAIAA